MYVGLGEQGQFLAGLLPLGAVSAQLTLSRDHHYQALSWGNLSRHVKPRDLDGEPLLGPCGCVVGQCCA